MVWSGTTTKQRAARAGRGDLTALESALRDLINQMDLNEAAGEATRRANTFELFDDFTYATIDTTDNWIVFAGANATAPAVVTAPEGKVNLVSGVNGAAYNDCSVMSLILLAKGSLVSLGTTVFECRVATAQITGQVISCGLSDKLATTATETPLHTVKAGVVEDGGLTVTDAISWCLDSEATAPTKWQMTSEKTTAIVATEVPAVSHTAAANVYVKLRIEVDSAGTGKWYINDVLELTRENAVATTALLIPYIACDAEDGTPVATTLSVDYVYFSGTRPASNA